MLKQRLQTLKIIFYCFDFLLSLIASFSAAFLHFYIFSPHKQKDIVLNPEYSFFLIDFLPSQLVFLAPYLHLGLFFSLSQVIIFNHIGVYQLRHRFYAGSDLISILKGVFGNLFIVLSLLFFYRPTSFSRTVLFSLPFLTTLFVFLGHRALWVSIQLFYQNIQRFYTVLIIGSGQTAQDVIQALSPHRALGYHVLGFIGNKAAKMKQQDICTWEIYPD